MKRPDWFLLGMVLAVLLAWLLPAPGAKGGSLHPELLNKLGVSLIFFLHGLTSSFAALGAGARNWRLHLLVQACTFLLCPLLGVLLLAGFGRHLSVDLRTGLFFLCALPSTVSSSVALTATAKGNVPAAVFNATLSSLLGVVLTPLWLSLVLGATGQALPIASVILDLALWLVLPLFIGQLLRPMLGAFATRHKSRISVLDRLTILLLVYTSFCDSVQDGVWRAGGGALLVSALASVAILAATMLSVWQLSRALHFALPDRIVALFCGSKKTLASGVPMARLIFGAHPGLGIILLPIMLYHPLQLVVGGWLAGRFARSTTTPHVPASADRS
ncbi:MAG TPA: bile acid:sodium symporter family protein [Polyangiaceae bacterium]|nr:bile acid:sodium symporter family protein [Polyangiaceae bacterium]